MCFKEFKQRQTQKKNTEKKKLKLKELKIYIKNIQMCLADLLYTYFSSHFFFFPINFPFDNLKFTHMIIFSYINITANIYNKYTISFFL